MNKHDMVYLINRISEVVYFLDKDSNVVVCNDKQLELFDLNSFEQAKGKNVFDFAKMFDWPKDVAQEIRDNDVAVMTSKQAAVKEESVVLHGELKHYHSHKYPWYDEEGNVIGIMGVGIDVTEKKRADALHEKDKISQQEIKQLEIFGGALAHELRTPLVGAKMGIAGLEKFLPRLLHAYRLADKNNLLDNDDTIANSKLGLLDELCERNRNQIDYALFFIDIALANIRQKYVEEKELQSLSMIETVNTALTKYPFASGDEKRVIWKSEEATDFTYRGDATLTCHVLFNLIKNALYFIHNLPKAYIEISLHSNEQFNQLHFTDYGPGIAADILPYIFDRFYSKRQHGSGVGLAFCQMIMENYDGLISCESQTDDNSYTRFILSFPK